MTVGVHICWRRVTELKGFVRKCPTCGKRTRQVGELEDYFGWTITCCACGDRWQDGVDGLERCPRPFERGWRKKAIAAAQELWCKARERKNVEVSL